MKFLPEKILRRYTPPTCTLEIWGRSWQGLQKLRALPVEYRFQLHFDDPRLDEDQQASLQGDREQLRQLFELLVPYLQDFLDPQQGPARAQTTLSGPLTLRPLDLLRHEFHFPGLSSGPKEVLILSTSQLFDLVSALEAWQETQGAEQQPEPIAVLRPKIWALAASGLGVIVALVWGVSRFNRPSPEPITPALRPSSIPFAISNVIPPVPPPPPPMPKQAPKLATVLALRDPLPAANPVQPEPSPPRNPLVTLVVPPLSVRPLLSPPPVQPLVNLKGPNPQSNLAVLPLQQGPISNWQGQILASPPPLPPLNAITTAPMAPLASPLVAPSISNQTLLDTIPQVAQVREYYQKNWQPPTALSQTLEYRLRLNSNGSLKQIMPLGKAATFYLAQLPQPSEGEIFVSPLESSGQPLIRLVLTTAGTVQTFLDE